MKIRDAKTILEKTYFNNREDWETYPTADYTCDECGQIISISLKHIEHHALNEFSNLNQSDQENIKSLITEKVDVVPSSYLDFYCPKCRKPVRIYYDCSYGGHHGESWYTLKYIVD